MGGSLEAGAGSDGATVTLSVLKKDLALGLDLLAEVLLQPAFAPDELTRKVTDIQGALRRSEQEPETVAARELSRMMFPGHPYGRPVYGTIESVGRITREQVIAFYQRHYRPDGANIVAVGDVTVEEIRRELLRRLAGWAAPPAPVGAVAKAPTVTAIEERKIVRDLTQTTVLLGRPSIKQDDPDYFALAVATYVLGGGSASRLYTRVREERGLAYSVYSSLSPARHGASYLVSLQTRTDGVVEAVRLTREEMTRLAREPVAPRELSLAKSYLIGSFPAAARHLGQAGALPGGGGGERPRARLPGALQGADRARHRGRCAAGRREVPRPRELLGGSDRPLMRVTTTSRDGTGAGRCRRGHSNRTGRIPTDMARDMNSTRGSPRPPLARGGSAPP